ncbi:MAG: hypothetical protein Q9172_006414 [Xanthocarpia lactea]
MNPGWSRKNGSSKEETIPPDVQPSRGRPPRPSLKDRTISAPSIVRDDAQSPPALSGSRSQSPPHVNSKSNNATAKDNSQIAQSMPQITLAVVGTSCTGKSTFVQHALDLKRIPTAAVSSKKVSLEGVVSLLRIYEFNIHDVDITLQGNPQWPRLDGEDTKNQIDGIMVIYSISDVSSTKFIPSFLRACSKSAIPTVLVCSKCDVPPEIRQVDSQITEQLRNGVVGDIQMYQTSIKAPDSHKRCLSFILRNIGLRTTDSTKIRKASSVSKREHRRAQSDYPNNPDRDELPPPFTGEGQGRREFVSAGISQEGEFPPPSTDPQPGTSSPDQQGRTPCDPIRHFAALRRGDGDLPSINDGCGLDLQHKEQMQTLIPLSASASTGDDDDMRNDTLKDAGVSFHELVDRLLSNTDSKTDVRFVAIFLCLYRKFSAPSDLLAAIISRFHNVKAGKIPQAIRSAAQLRYLGVLAQWAFEYPGDFAHPLTRLRMEGFISGLAGQRTFSMVIKEITRYLDIVSEDDDTAWACSDITRSRTDTLESSPTISSVPSTSSLLDKKSSIKKTASNESESPAHVPQRGSVTSSITSSTDKSSTQTLSSAPGQSTVESAQDQARLLAPYPRTTLCKVHWHLFMRTSDEDIAQELTRIDWIMFASIRPRDLVRHVSLPEAEKEQCKSLQNVTRMIDQFNHIAFWIANIILLRDKSKHRAKALEKCMAIAWRLRQLNNYNSLGAVVAGINGTAVHRLYQTRELVPHHIQKQFMRLEILMGTQKSHFAYRLAWSNTSTERIPFLPLHSRDLASAEEGNSTYIGEGGDRINWKKFEVIGEVVVSIQRSQATSYWSILRNEEVQRLIQDSKFSKDDDVSTIIDGICWVL